MMHEVALLQAENKTLREANTSLAKRCKAKRSRLQEGGTLIIGEAQDLLDQKDVDIQLREETRTRSGRATRSEPRSQRCGICGTAGHNTRTCEINAETSEEPESD